MYVVFNEKNFVQVSIMWCTTNYVILQRRIAAKIGIVLGEGVRGPAAQYVVDIKV
jgi:hypothetical protein